MVLLVLLFWNEVSSIWQGELSQVISGAANLQAGPMDPTPSDYTREARTWKKRAHMISDVSSQTASSVLCCFGSITHSSVMRKLQQTH